MELYFNPYPSAAQSAEIGIRLIIDTADALCRLEKALNALNISLSGEHADSEAPLSRFILYREERCGFNFENVIYKVKSPDREKLILLLNKFSKGRVINLNEIGIENWIVSNIGTAAPILEAAAKNNAIALTIPTESEWRIDRITFDKRDDFLHNLWGQQDISILKTHCIDALENIPERFCAQYGAKFCDGALNSAPHRFRWKNLGFFHNMDKAKERGYEIDDNLIKNVGDTKYGTLLELRCYNQGQRIFLVFMPNATPQILIGGFYHKSGGINQDEAIEKARKRVNDTLMPPHSTGSRHK